MGRHVEIKKIQETPSEHYYSVTSPDYPHIPVFYININPAEKKMRLYKGLGDKPECEFFVENCESDQLPYWIPSFLLYATIKKVRQAIAENQFGDYMSFQS